MTIDESQAASVMTATSASSTSARTTSVWYRVAGLVYREQKDLAVEIIEAEIRSGHQEASLDAAKLTPTGEPGAIARKLRDLAESPRF